MEYVDYFLEQAIDGDGPLLTDHGPASTMEEQAIRRFARRDSYRELVIIDTETYLEEINE